MSFFSSNIYIIIIIIIITFLFSYKPRFVTVDQMLLILSGRCLYTVALRPLSCVCGTEQNLDVKY